MVALTASTFSQHASADVSVLIPQWLRDGYSALAFEQVRGREQRSLDSC